MLCRPAVTSQQSGVIAACGNLPDALVLVQFNELRYALMLRVSRAQLTFVVAAH